MARIRSVHPALFTDEAWVGCSIIARILIVGLWTDADDQGVFEWKPVQLKMRLLPADDVNVAILLDELACADIIRPFEAAGKRYGAIKNFQKNQRPKKPNAIHPLPPELAVYVAQKRGSGGEGDLFDAPPFPPRGGSGGEQVPHSKGSGGEEVNQMEDGGCRGMGESPPTPPSEGRADDWDQAGLDAVIAEAIAAYPDAGKAHTRPKLVARAWPAEAQAAGGAAVLLACLRAYAEIRRGTDAAPSLQKWLTDGRWRIFLKAPPPAENAPAAWSGPPGVWSAVVAHAEAMLPLKGGTGHGYAVSWLLPTTWQDVPTKAVVCRSGRVAERLRRECGPVFRRLDVEVILQRAEVAA